MPLVNGLTRRWRLPDRGAEGPSDGGDDLGTVLCPPDRASVGSVAGRGVLAVAAGFGSKATRTSLVDRVLAARGVHGADAVRAFCDPRLSQLHDPGLMSGIDAASERIVTALRRRERIAIYGDYDVDGVTASAVLFHVLRAADPEAVVRCYVPHRVDEGYGLHADAMRLLHGEGTSLVVSVDCGITAIEPARIARELGMDLVITDHHQPREDGLLPRAVAIVHPALRGPDGRDAYPCPDLCGAGVAFKLAWRVATRWCGSERVSERFRRTLLDLLPLVALGTIADVVPLRGENRVLASAGLRAIRGCPLPGLAALVQESGLADDRIDCEKVGFVLAPRLNACGRLGHAEAAVRLFTEADHEESTAIARDLAALNRERQRTEQAIVEHACAMAESSGQTGRDHRAIVLAHESWHPGVVGVVCSRLVERYGRPTILLQAQGELCRGSGRSVEEYSLHEGLCACAALLEHFGGHRAAAGVAVRADRLDAFRAAFVAHVNGHLSPEALVPLLPVDCDAEVADMDLETVRHLGRLSPFGRGNRRPAILLRDLAVSAAPRILKERHLKLAVSSPASSLRGGRELEAIWWGAAEHASALRRGARVDAVVEPRISDWSGRVELEVRDVRRREPG